MTTLNTAATIEKRSASGHPVTRWPGRVVNYDTHHLLLECFFDRDLPGEHPDVRAGDRVLEWFFTDCWYNIFEFHDVSDDHLKGWYCNITRPAIISESSEGLLIAWDDLALDVFITPDGRFLLLDEDELAELNLSADDVSRIWDAVDQLRRLVDEHAAPFETLL